MAFQQCQQMADKKQPPADSTPMMIAVVQLSYCPQKKQWTHRQHSIACSKRRRVRTDQRASDGVSYVWKMREKRRSWMRMSELGVLSHLLRQQISLSYIYANVHGIDVGLAGRILTEPSSSELLLIITRFFNMNLNDECPSGSI